MPGKTKELKKRKKDIKCSQLKNSWFINKIYYLEVLIASNILTQLI